MSNAQQIYTALRQAGMTEAGALGVMGNLQAESGLEACRVQGDYQSGFAASKVYVSRIDTGELSVDAASSDGRGLGLAQWTYKPRKAALIRYAQGFGVSVGALDLQLRFLINELQSDYGDLWRYLCRTDNLYEAVTRVCKEFERPAYNNIDQRYKFAQELRAGLQEAPAEPAAPASEYWPPRMICSGMTGPDVGVLQCVLRARGQTIGDSLDVFGGSTEAALIRTQQELGLDADGICGPKSWAKILERGGAL